MGSADLDLPCCTTSDTVLGSRRSARGRRVKRGPSPCWPPLAGRSEPTALPARPCTSCQRESAATAARLWLQIYHTVFRAKERAREDRPGRRSLPLAQQSGGRGNCRELRLAWATVRDLSGKKRNRMGGRKRGRGEKAGKINQRGETNIESAPGKDTAESGAPAVEPKRFTAPLCSLHPRPVCSPPCDFHTAERGSIRVCAVAVISKDAWCSCGV